MQTFEKRCEGIAYKVFPCRREDVILNGRKYKSKSPLTKQGFLDASDSIAQIRAWSRQYPDALIGVPTGNGLIVVDVDYEDSEDGIVKNGYETIKTIPNYTNPPTRIHKTTRGGEHRLYHGDGVKNSASDIAKDVDTRGDGGYIIWWAAEGLEVIDAPIAPLPSWVKPALAAAAGKRNKSDDFSTTGEGGRNNDMISYAGMLANDGRTHTEMLDMMREHNKSYSPPLDDSEVLAVWKSAKKFQKGTQQDREEPASESRGYDLADLVGLDLPPPEFILNPFIAEGLTIFAGKPKIGKTTFIRQLIIAANNGSDALSETCAKVKALFLCLEEGERTAAKKFKDIATIEQMRGVRIEFSWERGHAGCKKLREYMSLHPMTKLIVVDSLTRFRSIGSSKESQFSQDYLAVAELQAITKEYQGLAIVVLHHCTKAKFDDPMDAISGTFGLSAACDSYGVIMKENDQYRLHWGGRHWDIENHDYELFRHDNKWEIMGAWDFEKNGLPKVQAEIVSFLKFGALKTSGIASRLDVSLATASEHMKKMKQANIVKNSLNGWILT